jgi:hypothetical protein
MSEHGGLSKSRVGGTAVFSRSVSASEAVADSVPDQSINNQPCLVNISTPSLAVSAESPPRTLDGPTS